MRDIRLADASPSSARSTASSCKARPGRSTARGCRERPGDYGQLSRRRLMAGAFMNAGDYVQAQRRRLEMIAEVEAAFRQVDVLLCASSMDPPCRIDRPADVDRTYPRQARTPFNVTGHPRARHAGRAVGRRPAAVGAVRRPLLRGKYPVPGGARLGALGRHGQEAPARIVLNEETNVVELVLVVRGRLVGLARPGQDWSAMSSKRQLRLGAFMRPVSIHTAAWRYPGGTPDANFNLKALIRYAQTLERGKFDAFFMADHLAVLNMPMEALEAQRHGDLVRLR